MTAPVDPHGPPPPLSRTQWLIVVLAAIGFAFDIYELLMLPLIIRPALLELGGLKPGTADFAYWVNLLFYVPAVAGGIFGLLGGYLTDLFGRRRVLTWSILLYAFSAFAAAFSTSLPMLLVFRCLTFIGFCIEFVAAVAWLSELFTHPTQREKVLGYTQAFSSFGGLMVAEVFGWCVEHSRSLPAVWVPEQFDAHAPWRYTLMSGLFPALPLILIRPFLPESPAWEQKRKAGTLRRPNIVELFQPKLRKTTILTTLMMACVYATALGAIQQFQQIVPGQTEVRTAKAEAEKKAKAEAMAAGKKGPAIGAAVAAAGGKEDQGAVRMVTSTQEVGGLVGRFALAVLAVWVLSRRTLLRIFQVPGLFLVPIGFYLCARPDLGVGGMMAVAALAGFFTVAQLSFWGNYLPLVYPLHLRGTGEGFAANIGGRLIGTFAAVVTNTVALWIINAHVADVTGEEAIKAARAAYSPVAYAYAATGMAAFTFLVGSICCFFLPEPDPKAFEED